MIAFNSAPFVFQDNASLRKAVVNFALNRRAIVNGTSARASVPSDQYLPSIMPGSGNADVYPLERPNLAKAQELARGNPRGGRVVMYT